MRLRRTSGALSIMLVEIAFYVMGLYLGEHFAVVNKKINQRNIP